MKRILFLLLLSVISYTLIAQTGPSKKCPTCGLSMAQCQYKGKHPKCSTCGKLLTQCQYKGKHPKCSTCGKLLTQCQYKGKHPKCSTCGKLLTQCQYKGKHPKCSTCGKLLTECQYKGNHPKCSTCGELLTECQYKGNHPKCSTCGELLTQCQYRGNHPKCSTCGKLLTQCQYKGNHSKCSTCGELLTECQYKGNHPKCSTCGKLLTQCQYGGKHPTTGIINGHEWVDLGLSVKWATCNVGATNPSDYGGYYAWGETHTKFRYDWSNCFDCLDSEGNNWGIYKTDGETAISPTSGHDTARENWGGRWRMPTNSELNELHRKCEWVWTSRGGHNGYVVTGPNGNCIFLPAAGYRDGADFGSVGGSGFYWSRNRSSSYSYDAHYLYFRSGYCYTYVRDRYFGFSVRPVAD